MTDPATNERSAVGVLLWNTCNARCAHCMPDCGPKDRQSLTNEEIFSVIADAIGLHGNNWVLALSGGEPFLYPDRLSKIVGYRHDERHSTTLVSNAFWAVTEQRALDVLKPLVANGLTSIAFSVSRYHFEYVNQERVENAILAARTVGLHVAVKAVVSLDSPPKYVLGAIRRAEPWSDEIDVQLIDVIPQGRAALDESIKGHITDDLPVGKCPAEILTIMPDGNASPCCNGAGETKSLDLGNVRDLSLSEINDNHRKNPTMVELREKGPASLLSKLPPDVEKQMRNSDWVNVCHLCCEVLKLLPKDDKVVAQRQADFA